MQNNLRMKTLKPVIKDVEPNKYMLEVVKFCDPGQVKGHVTYIVNFWTPCITFEWKKLYTSFFLC